MSNWESRKVSVELVDEYQRSLGFEWVQAKVHECGLAICQPDDLPTLIVHVRSAAAIIELPEADENETTALVEALAECGINWRGTLTEADETAFNLFMDSWHTGVVINA